MHVKFLDRGKGSARAAADYLLGERDSAGQLREVVKVVRGDPAIVAAVADSLAFERKYTSAVIAWAPDDRPSAEQIGPVLDTFEQTAWAGLEPDRYSWTAVVRTASIHRSRTPSPKPVSGSPRTGSEMTSEGRRSAVHWKTKGRRPGGKARCSVKKRDGSRTEVDMLWINEGFVLDDAGNVLTTSYIDLRDEAERTVVRSLVKGCRREHALEDGETLLISKPERFREYGVEFIRDEQEGFAREEHVAVEAETPQEEAKRRATADLNDALQLVGSVMKPVHRVEHSRRKTRTESFSYGKDWWVFCASIRPDEAEWDAWRASLDEDYDHVSEIGQPAKFAQALARMVTEQIGPRGKDARLTGTSDGAAGARTKHRNQWVIHGPVVYTNRLYDMLTGKMMK